MNHMRKEEAGGMTDMKRITLTLPDEAAVQLVVSLLRIASVDT